MSLHNCPRCRCRPARTHIRQNSWWVERATGIFWQVTRTPELDGVVRITNSCRQSILVTVVYMRDHYTPAITRLPRRGDRLRMPNGERCRVVKTGSDWVLLRGTTGLHWEQSLPLREGIHIIGERVGWVVKPERGLPLRTLFNSMLRSARRVWEGRGYRVVAKIRYLPGCSPRDAVSHVRGAQAASRTPEQSRRTA